MLVGTFVAEGFGLSADRIKVQSNLANGITWLGVDPLFALVGDSSLWKMALAIAVIASAETLLVRDRGGPDAPRSADQLRSRADGPGCWQHSVRRARGPADDRASSFGRPRTSRPAPGRGWSATMHGLWLLLFVAFLPTILQKIPEACLAAVLVYTGFKLVDWRAGCRLWKESRGECLIFVATLLGVVFTDLLTGVLIGVALTAAKLVYTVSHLTIRPERDEPRREVHLHLEGAATFICLPKLARALEAIPTGWGLHVYLDDLLFIDHTCLHLLTEWEKQHRATGGQLSLDQDGLRARFDRPRSTRHRPILGGNAIDYMTTARNVG